MTGSSEWGWTGVVGRTKQRWHKTLWGSEATLNCLLLMGTLLFSCIPVETHCPGWGPVGSFALVSTVNPCSSLSLYMSHREPVGPECTPVLHTKQAPNTDEKNIRLNNITLLGIDWRLASFLPDYNEFVHLLLLKGREGGRERRE